VRIDAINNQMRYPVGKRLCLAGPCPSNHKQRPTSERPLIQVAVFDRPALFFI